MEMWDGFYSRGENLPRSYSIIVNVKDEITKNLILIIRSESFLEIKAILNLPLDLYDKLKKEGILYHKGLCYSFTVRHQK